MSKITLEFTEFELEVFYRVGNGELNTFLAFEHKAHSRICNRLRKAYEVTQNREDALEREYLLNAIERRHDLDHSFQYWELSTERLREIVGATSKAGTTEGTED